MCYLTEAQGALSINIGLAECGPPESLSQQGGGLVEVTHWDVDVQPGTQEAS